MARSELDAIVIGAGVAGLSAADELSRHGFVVEVLEARDRTGGRIWTVHRDDYPAPIERGAEFIHGRDSDLESLLTRANLTVVDVSGIERHLHRGHLSRVPAFFDDMEAVLGDMDPKRSPDRSFADYLKHSTARHAPQRARLAAQRFVEGFQAADITKVSERWLASASGVDGEEYNRAGRIAGGYSLIIDHLAANLKARLHLGTTVEKIRWEPGHAIVEAIREGRGRRYLARTVLITVPTGVLHSGHLLFQPDPVRIRRALEGMIPGHVFRATLLFRRYPLEMVKKAPDDIHQSTFIRHEAGRIPIWWTPYPVRAPALVAWTGGAQARRLLGLKPSALKTELVASLADMLGHSPVSILKELVAIETWNWTDDPFSLCAYSYVGVDGSSGPLALSRPEAGTLFFAGEAITSAEKIGTVGGALGSGLRAARLMHRVLAR